MSDTSRERQATAPTDANGHRSAHSSSDGQLIELAERLERVCLAHGRGGDLRGLLEEAGKETLLEELSAVLAQNEFHTDRLAALLDAVDEALSTQGVHGLTRPNREWRELPGVKPAVPQIEAWFCPVARCTRAEKTPADCTLTERRLDAAPFTP
ncbi:hypothetical protein AB0L50_26245 [Streptomyces flaveolus]|uniref:hypothetical protein n=1 Tax=Streptomyces flaveolus TaxID=67297 RepID=UPI0034292DD1